MNKLVSNRGFWLTLLLLIVTALTMTGCLFSGTYTRNGNTATFSGDLSGTATISGNNMSGTFDGSPFTAARADTMSNSFAGTWAGTMDGKSVEFIIGNTVWAVSVSGSSPNEGGFLENTGNALSLIGINSGGTASISGNRLAGTFGGSSFTTARANTSSNPFTRASTGSNPFIGTWLTVIDGVPVEFIIGNTTWLVGVRE